jgi:hypothetical protein
VGWVRTAARRTALSLRRNKDEQIGGANGDHDLKRIPISVDAELEYLKNRYQAEFKRAVEDAIATLGTEQLRVLRLHYHDGLSIDRIGALLGAHRHRRALDPRRLRRRARRDPTPAARPSWPEHCRTRQPRRARPESTPPEPGSPPSVVVAGSDKPRGRPAARRRTPALFPATPPGYVSLHRRRHRPRRRPLGRSRSRSLKRDGNGTTVATLAHPIAATARLCSSAAPRTYPTRSRSSPIRL